MSEKSQPRAGTTAEAWIREWDGEAPDPELLGAYLDGELDAVDRGIVESWLADDTGLADELEALRRLRADLGEGVDAAGESRRVAPPRPSRRARKWSIAAGLAAALVAALGLGVLREGRPGAERIVDGGFEVRLVDGAVDAAGDLPDAFAESILKALRSGSFEIPEAVLTLRGVGGTLLSGEEEDGGPAPISPVGTAVLDARPLFRWRPVPGAAGYRVTVADETLRTVASSPGLPGPGWRPPSDLPTGRVLTWQVEATTAAGAVRAPIPPAPEARFVVLDDVERVRVENRLRLAGVSRLAAAVTYLEAGLLERAVGELDLLAAEQDDPAAVERLRSSID